MPTMGKWVGVGVEPTESVAGASLGCFFMAVTYCYAPKVAAGLRVRAASLRLVPLNLRHGGWLAAF